MYPMYSVKPNVGNLLFNYNHRTYTNQNTFIKKIKNNLKLIINYHLQPPVREKEKEGKKNVRYDIFVV